MIRAGENEKEDQIRTLQNLHGAKEKEAKERLQALKETALNNGNLFEQLMETAKVCSLGQITHALYEVGGQYRRNM